MALRTQALNNQSPGILLLYLSMFPSPMIRYTSHLTQIRGWNAAFGENSASMAEISATVSQQSPPLYHPTSLGLPPQSAMGSTVQQPYSIPPHIPPLPQQTPNQMSNGVSNEPSFVSPSMWRDSIASTWDRTGMKRGWDDQNSYFADSMPAKRTR